MTPERFLGVSTTDLPEPLGLGGQSRNPFHCIGTVGLDLDDRVGPIEVRADRLTIGRLPDQDCARRRSLEIARANTNLPADLPLDILLPRRRHEEAASLRHVGEKIAMRSEEHTSELQSPCNLVCRLLLEKKKNK